MGKIVILADSTCDLSQDIIKDRDIKIIPLKVTFKEQIYKDQQEINCDKLYELVKENNMLPKTSAPTIDEYKEIFVNEVEKGNDVISISISSNLSSAYQQSLIAYNDLDESYKSHVFCIDSKNLSTGIGLLVLKASDMVISGMEAKEIYNNINNLVDKVRAQFSVKDLEYLHKGGRCSGTSRFFGTLLRIHPILRVIEGAIILSEKVFGRYGQALDLQIKDVLDNINNVDKDYLFITSTSAEVESDYIVEKLPDKIKKTFKNIIVNTAGCVITSHCGKGTIGMLYIKNSKVTK